jgi:hypothetical protein
MQQFEPFYGPCLFRSALSARFLWCNWFFYTSLSLFNCRFLTSSCRASRKATLSRHPINLMCPPPPPHSHNPCFAHRTRTNWVQIWNWRSHCLCGLSTFCVPPLDGWMWVLWKKTPWPESASELYRPSDHRLPARLVPTFAYRGCHVVSVTNPYVLILGFLDRSRCYFFHEAPQLYSWGWVDSVTDPPLLRKSGSAGNRTRTSGSAARNSDH